MSRTTVIPMLVAALLAGSAAEVPAAYPQKTVTLITHSSPGGGTDLFLRQAIGHLSPIMGTTFVVENIKGGGGAKALAALAKAPADGGTFYGATPTYLMTGIQGGMDVSYKDFQPVVNVFFDPMIAYTSVASRFRTLKEAVEYAKQNPGQAKWGTGTPASLEQMVVQRLKQTSGVSDVAIVSFEGGGDTMLNVLGGRLDMAVGEPAEVLAQLEEGKLRLLGVFSAERLKNFPDVQTAREQGYDVVITKYRGIIGPKGLPPEVVKAWEEAIPKLLADPEYSAVYEKENLHPAFMGSKEFTEYTGKRAAEIEAFFKEMGLIK